MDKRGIAFSWLCGLALVGCGGTTDGQADGTADGASSSSGSGSQSTAGSTEDPDSSGDRTGEETGEPPVCNPDNCEGCCDGDACVEGTAVSACGTDGGQCSACPEGSSCDAGVCNLPCEDTCDGCCEGETCVEFDTQSGSTCGLEGAVCVSCGVDFDCVAGSCISLTCAQECDGCCNGAMCLDGDQAKACGSDGVACEACGPNSTCEADGCVPDPMALWDVTVVDGVIALTDPEGTPWDSFNGLPDPYAVVEVVGATGETEVQDDTIFPVWDAVVLEAVSTTQLQGGLTIEVSDSDIGLDTSLGECSGETVPLGGSGTVTCTVGDEDYETWSVTLSIEPSLK